ncbi:peptide ABC transporter substrate-binding protein [Weissella paramesenteroides]|nr:peptide ABC transporter substrate-binding protein [Weissella paramesenteroides]KAA8437701.1 peptide ABC transporter substrate-binding protein [Weissella paramesenteroides]
MGINKIGWQTAVLATSVIAGIGVVTHTADAKAKQVISTYSSTEISSLDTAKATELNAFTQLDNITEGLYVYDSKGRPQKALAQKTKISEDKKTYTIDIRKDAKWSNGDPVTAADFVFAWQRAVDPKTASEYAYLFDNIENAKAIQDGEKTPDTLGVKATDKHQLQIQLVAPQEYFKMILARETLAPLNEKFVEQQGDKYGTSSKTTLYNGPFVSKGWSGSTTQWTLNKNPYYWDKKHVKLSKINYSVIKDPSTAYNLYQTKKLDQMTLVGEQAQQLSKHKDVVKRNLAATSYLQYNLKKNNGLENAKIRQAISLSINRKQLTERILKNGSKPAAGFVPRQVATKPNGKEDFYDATKVKNTAEYKPKLAKKLFAEGLKEVGKDKISATVITADASASEQVAVFIQDQLQKNLPKLELTLQKVPQKSRIASVNAGNFDISFQGWSADFADPYTFLQIFPSDSAQNHTGWKNEAYDQAITDSLNKNAANKTARWNDLVKAEKILMKDQVVTPIYQQNNEDLVNPRLKGIGYNQINGHYSYKLAYVTGK